MLSSTRCTIGSYAPRRSMFAAALFGLGVALSSPAAAHNDPVEHTHELAVPAPEILLVLIRTTLIALDQAVQTGNFTVLRDLGSPELQAANTATQLGLTFQDLRKGGIDLSPVAVVTPKMTETPVITPENMLRLAGYFPTQPLHIQFQMLFEQVNSQWRLAGMAVHAVSPEAQANAQTPAGTPKQTDTRPE